MKLSEELNLVTANLRERGWTTGTLESDDDGKVCAHGAVQTCQGLQPGDEHIIRALMTAQGITFDWNDSEASGIDEVAARISGVDTSDEALAATFGPQWLQIVGLVRTVAGLSDEQAIALDAAWYAARDAARALVVRDLIGTHGFTQEHYDVLTKPWRTVIGQLHEDDESVQQ